MLICFWIWKVNLMNMCLFLGTLMRLRGSERLDWADARLSSPCLFHHQLIQLQPKYSAPFTSCHNINKLPIPPVSRGCMNCSVTWTTRINLGGEKERAEPVPHSQTPLRCPWVRHSKLQVVLLSEKRALISMKLLLLNEVIFYNEKKFTEEWKGFFFF